MIEVQVFVGGDIWKAFGHMGTRAASWVKPLQLWGHFIDGKVIWHDIELVESLTNKEWLKAGIDSILNGILK